MKDEGFADSFLACNLSFFICHWSVCLVVRGRNGSWRLFAVINPGASVLG